MKYTQETEQERFLKIFEDRSEYVSSSGDTQEFKEGKVSAASKARIKTSKIRWNLGFLKRLSQT